MKFFVSKWIIQEPRWWYPLIRECWNKVIIVFYKETNKASFKFQIETGPNLIWASE